MPTLFRLPRPLAAALALLAAGFACAGRPEPEPGPAFVRLEFALGRVVAVVGSGHVVLDEYGLEDGERRRAYAVSPETACVNVARLSDVRTNDEVAIVYCLKNGKRLATHLVDKGQTRIASLDDGWISPELALNFGPSRLAQLIDFSECEVAQDMAACLYAAAKRQQTEAALSKRDPALVGRLNQWREAISECREGSWKLARIIFGGGTMYTHGAVRDTAEVERFLAYLATRMPFGSSGGPCCGAAAASVDRTVATVRSLQVTGEDAESVAWSKEQLPAAVQDVTAKWAHLKELLDGAPPFEAKEIAVFTAESLAVLDPMFDGAPVAMP